MEFVQKESIRIIDINQVPKITRQWLYMYFAYCERLVGVLKIQIKRFAFFPQGDVEGQPSGLPSLNATTAGAKLKILHELEISSRFDPIYQSLWRSPQSYVRWSTAPPPPDALWSLCQVISSLSLTSLVKFLTWMPDDHNHDHCWSQPSWSPWLSCRLTIFMTMNCDNPAMCFVL